MQAHKSPLWGATLQTYARPKNGTTAQECDARGDAIKANSPVQKK
jgi:hypothetical protein